MLYEGWLEIFLEKGIYIRDILIMLEYLNNYYIEQLCFIMCILDQFCFYIKSFLLIIFLYKNGLFCVFVNFLLLC